MRLLSVGDQVKPGTYRFHSRFNRVVNFEHRGWLIAVVDEAIGPGPLNIVLRGLAVGVPAIPGLKEQTPLRITTRSVLFAGRRYSFTSRRRYDSTLHYDVTVPLTKASLSRNRTARSAWSARSLLPLSNRSRPYDSASKLDALQTLRAAVHPNKPSRLGNSLKYGSAERCRFRRNLSALGELLKEAAPPKSLAFLVDSKRREHFRAGFERTFAAQIARGVYQVFHGRRLQGIRRLKGCGLGLTPAGDDFIAGFLIGLHLLEKLRGQKARPTADAVCRAARGKNIFSNTFLDLARRGWLFGHMKDLLLALVSGSEGAVRRAARKLLGIGETSGADLAIGLFMTVRKFWLRAAQGGPSVPSPATCQGTRSR